MKFGKVEQLRDELIGFRPVYCETGNSTELLLKNGEVVLDKRISTSIEKALTMSYSIDRKAQRRQLQASLNRQGGPFPLYLPRGRVFIPLKMRRAVTANDSVYGYIDMACMGEPQAVSGQECAVKLANGLKLKVLSNRKTVLGVQHEGLAVQVLMQTERADEINNEQVIAAIRLLINAFAMMVSKC